MPTPLGFPPQILSVVKRIIHEDYKHNSVHLKCYAIQTSLKLTSICNFNPYDLDVSSKLSRHLTLPDYLSLASINEHFNQEPDYNTSD